MQELCKVCAEYGSEFCEDCVTESGEKTVEISQLVRNIANYDQALGSKDTNKTKE